MHVKLPYFLSALLLLLLILHDDKLAAQQITSVHGLHTGQCIQFNDFAGWHTATVAEEERAGGYQVTYKTAAGTDLTIPVAANSRDMRACPATSAAQTKAADTTARTASSNAAARNPAQARAVPNAWKVGDYVQFSYGGGLETATIAGPEVGGGYPVNWGTIRASAPTSDLRPCPAGANNPNGAAETKAALARLPKGNGLGAQYGTRDPAVCANRKAPINASTAKMYLACDEEGVLSPDLLTLITGVSLQLGAPRAFNYNQDSSAVAIDPHQPVYDIKGSYTVYQCAPLSERPTDYAKTHNCFKYPATAGGYGRCFTDTLGDHHCIMTGGGPTQLKDQPPPN